MPDNPGIVFRHGSASGRAGLLFRARRCDLRANQLTNGGLHRIFFGERSPTTLRLWLGVALPEDSEIVLVGRLPGRRLEDAPQKTFGLRDVFRLDEYVTSKHL